MGIALVTYDYMKRKLHAKKINEKTSSREKNLYTIKVLLICFCFLLNKYYCQKFDTDNYSCHLILRHIRTCYIYLNKLKKIRFCINKLFSFFSNIFRNIFSRETLIQSYQNAKLQKI